jgi:single-strand DNA-binding protein
MRDINSLNRVTLIGRLGQNPEVRYLPQTERAVARFSLATNERFLNPKTNQTDDRTEWHRIVVWGKLAEFCEKYLIQGKQIYLEGKLRTRSWQDKEGNKRFTTEIEARNIVLLGKREEAVEEQAYPAEPKPGPEPPEEDEPSPDKEKEGEGGDDIPF